MVRILAGAKNFLFTEMSRPTLGAYPSSYSACTKGSFLVVKQVGHKADINIPTVSSFIMSGVTPPLLNAFKV
jgi:hypothetical protein